MIQEHSAMTSLTSPRSLLHLLIVIVFAMTSVVASAATERIIHNFDSLPHGDQPNGGLISDAAGDLFGVIWGGGPIWTCGGRAWSRRGLSTTLTVSRTETSPTAV